MQSTASTWFCTLCGAANEAGQNVCFSCNRARPGLSQDSAPLDDAASLLQGRYRLLSQVGVGGFGEVYKALDTQHDGRVVAIKQINLGGLSPQKTIEATDTFNRELQILSPLKHPNLPRIYDHFTDPDHWYLVMEFLEGETLERYLENRQRQRSYAGVGMPGLLPLEEIFDLAFQLCDVLDYLHEQHPSIIFRDLKPANIMRSGAGHICLIDFGIARHFRPGRTKDTIPLGSPGYAAPEQYGKAQTTARSDLYSLGALLHHLVTGNDPSETPFQFAPLPQLLPTSLAGTREMEALILRMVDVDSGRRPASAREVKEELQRIASLAAGSAEKRIWTPPPGQPPNPVVEGALQQQVQIQLQKQKTTTRRKFIRRGLLTGGAIIVGGALLETMFSNLLIDRRFEYIGPDDRHYDQGPGAFQGQGNITEIALSSDGNLLVTVTADTFFQDGNDTIRNVVKVYNIQKAYTVPVSPGEVRGTVSALAWSPDNTHLAIGFDYGSITIWNTSNGAEENTYTTATGQLENIAWSPDGKLIAVAGLDGVLSIISATDGSVVSSYDGNSVNESSFLSWSPDSTRIVAPYFFMGSQSPTGTFQVWDVQSSKTLRTFSELDVLQVAWSPNGNVIATLSVNSVLTLYDASNGQSIKSFLTESWNTVPAGSTWPVQLLWSSDSQYLALDMGGPSNGQIWNVQNGHERDFPSHLDSPRVIMWQPGRPVLSMIDANGRRDDFSASGL